MDVYARHRPRTCTSTHARNRQNRRNNAWAHSLFGVHSCPPVPSTHRWNSRFSWHCVETFVALLLLQCVYDGDNVGFRQKRWPTLRTTARCSTNPGCDCTRAWEHCKSLSDGQFGCMQLDKRCWAALKSLQRFTLEICHESQSGSLQGQRRGQVQVRPGCSCWTRNYSWLTRSSGKVARLSEGEVEIGFGVTSRAS